MDSRATCASITTYDKRSHKLTSPALFAKHSTKTRNTSPKKPANSSEAPGIRQTCFAISWLQYRSVSCCSRPHVTRAGLLNHRQQTLHPRRKTSPAQINSTVNEKI